MGAVPKSSLCNEFFFVSQNPTSIHKYGRYFTTFRRTTERKGRQREAEGVGAPVGDRGGQDSPSPNRSV